MRQKILSGIGLLLILITGLSVAWFGAGSAQARDHYYPTDEQAFLAILGDFMTFTGETADWRIGEIIRSGKFSVTIAQAGESAAEYQDFILLLARQDEAGEWSAVAPETVETKVYNQWLADMPDDLVNDFEKSYFYLYEETAVPSFSFRSVPLHHFPWAIRFEAVLTQKDGSYHTHQLDFVMRSINDIYASKPGLVVFVKDSSSVGGCDINLWPWANMVVVQHTATEYTWYVHLKQGSATVRVGDLIGYGTKIGEQGNTGFACGTTGIHLHYMASNAIPSGWPDPNVPNYAPWPPSESIYPVDFIEASYASLVVGNTYVSQNASPPGVCNISPAQVSFFDNTYCNSNLRSVSVAGLQNLFLLGLAAKVESIEIPQGWSVALYLDKNELGPKICLNASDSMLWDNLFSNGERVANNSVWARVYKSLNCPYPNERGIALYPQVNFGGTPLWGTAAAISSNEPGYVVGSIYLPDGYSVKIYDQDYKAGNTACFSSSVLDLALESSWAGIKVESLQLFRDNQCTPTPPSVPQPEPISPEDNGVAYNEDPEVCWQISGTGYQFNVNIFDGAGFNVSSGWISNTCYTSPDLAGRTGTYSWRIQARDTNLDLSYWSETFQFTLVDDTNPPIAEFAGIVEGYEVVRPRKNLSVNAQDFETEVASVYFFAWYDDGSGEYGWIPLGVDEDGSNGWQVVWNLVPVVSQDAAVWASAEDLGGNFASVLVSGLAVVDTPSSPGGNSYKTGGGNAEPPDTLPVIPGNPPDPDPPDSNEPSDPAIIVAPPDPIVIDPPAAPVEEPVVVVMPDPPAVVTPVFNEVYYLPDQIQLCWEEGRSESGFEYQVEINGSEKVVSPWMEAVCWQPSGLEAGSGEYVWRVKARETGAGESIWSAEGAFRLVLDEIEPVVSFLSPQKGEDLSGEVLIRLEAADLESGLQMAQVLAWYDGGDGAKWHELSREALTEDAIEVVWDVSALPAQISQLWVYVTDRAGNLGSALVPGLQLGTVGEVPAGAVRYHKSLEDLTVNPRRQ